MSTPRHQKERGELGDKVEAKKKKKSPYQQLKIVSYFQSAKKVDTVIINNSAFKQCSL